MKKEIKFIFIFVAIIGLLFTVPVYAMEGTDGTVDTPTNRMNPEEDNFDFDLDHDEIETGEGYENIVPLMEDNNDIINDENEGIHPAIYIIGGVVIIAVAGLVILTIKKKKTK